MAKILDSYGNRVRLNWKRILFDLNDFNLRKQYYAFRKHHQVSPNRAAYYVLCRNYSTTVIDRARFLGTFVPWAVFPPSCQHE